MIASDIMTRDLISCREDETIQAAAKTMIQKNIRGLPVLDSAGNLVGMITESDFIGKHVDIPHAMVSVKELLGEITFDGNIDEIFKKAKDRKLSEVMTKHIHTITPDSSISTITEIMLEENVSRLLVLDDGKLVGIVSKRDILRSFANL
ncbi:MAG: CBS domain-containing protein [Candidatus Lindowbacteria bacterium]|nr:CBS domain-containing protein [Candidatus Lindowbacteria bacterium]